MENKQLFTIYGAKLNKNGDRVNITLLRDNDGAKEWANISIKLDSSTAKTKATIKEGYAYIKVPMLKEVEKIEEEELF